MTNPTTDDPLTRWVASLDRGALATLRRSLAYPPGTWPPAFPFVERFTLRASAWDRQAAYLVAGLMASSRGGPQGSDLDLGAACAQLARLTSSGSIEARFVALLAADAEALPHHLRQMVALLDSRGVAPSWSRLHNDLRRWTHPDRIVQQRWARSYYAPTAPNEAVASSVAASATSAQEEDA